MKDWESALSGRRILVTGHTGFTGAWLCLWLQSIGCKVSGLALAPDTDPALYDEIKGDTFVDSNIQDINDAAGVQAVVADVKPDCIIHLAAQSLVRASYSDPVATFATNVMGTAHILEAARQIDTVQSVLCITTDKVYRNNEWLWAYRENDELGGKDPYSASKSACEMVIDSYRESLLEHKNNFALASARGGNIIGGGDWAADRIVPDFVRALNKNESLVLRNPEATRPWQHVLSLIHGYLMLTAALLERRGEVEGSWNFGPSRDEAKSVRTLVETLAENWRRPDIEYQKSDLHEAYFLALDSEKARQLLGWIAPWRFEDVARETASWYADVLGGESTPLECCRAQLEAYRAVISG